MHLNVANCRLVQHQTVMLLLLMLALLWGSCMFRNCSRTSRHTRFLHSRPALHGHYKPLQGQKGHAASGSQLLLAVLW